MLQFRVTNKRMLVFGANEIIAMLVNAGIIDGEQEGDDEDDAHPELPEIRICLPIKPSQIIKRGEKDYLDAELPASEGLVIELPAKQGETVRAKL